ncbi:MAG TPA: helix-turn-helix domain-containing protein [Solirubrobacteraceae bacterium]|nr:helix-turn-helix domain-containing protein [Solirubrobacteraceae bacterium]
MATESTRRRYEKRARAAQELQTRQRIIDAALALHTTVGPARTSISAIAERAGVRRATVYRHFPDERALFLGCSGTWRDRNPLPDPATWATISEPAVRLDAALDALYAWYERVEPMLSTILRDVEAMPIVAEIQKGRHAYLSGVEDGLAAGWGARGSAARRLRATIGLALDFLSWRTLHERGLSRADAVAVMSSAVRAAAPARTR